MFMRAINALLHNTCVDSYYNGHVHTCTLVLLTAADRAHYQVTAACHALTLDKCTRSMLPSHILCMRIPIIFLSLQV